MQNPIAEPDQNVGCRVLIVDDNPGSAKILGLLLSKMGPHQIREVHTGEDALATAHDMQPDIIVLDMVLGDCSGVHIAQQLRQQPRFDHTLMVALSGDSTQQSKQQAKDSGVDLYLVKPANIEDLTKVFACYREQVARF